MDDCVIMNEPFEKEVSAVLNHYQANYHCAGRESVLNSQASLKLYSKRCAYYRLVSTQQLLL